MVSRRDAKASSYPVNENEQSGARSPRAFTLPVLRAIEQRLVDRKLLKKDPQCHPLWFIAETERNTFLWRIGCSIGRQDSFEFWVDVEALIEKQLRILKEASDPTGKAQRSIEEFARRETAYLQRLSDLLGKIACHAYALSEIGLIIEKEIMPDKTRELVILPQSGRAGVRNPVGKTGKNQPFDTAGTNIR